MQIIRKGSGGKFPSLGEDNTWRGQFEETEQEMEKSHRGQVDGKKKETPALSPSTIRPLANSRFDRYQIPVNSFQQNP